jgi:glycerate-2-kinase
VIPHRLLASPATLTGAIARAAARQRLAPIVWPIHEVAPIREVAARLSDYVRALARGGERRLLVVGGEPIVTLPPGHGRGGRMQQLALLLSLELEGVKFRGLAAGSDGCEAGGSLAGALFDGGTAAALRGKGLDAAAALQQSASTPLWEALGTGLPAGPTGTNLADVVLLQAPWEPDSLRGP